MRVSIKAEIASRKAEGNFFRKDVSKTVMGNVLDMVEWLSDEGGKQLRAVVPVDEGFTRANIEGMTYKRTQMLTGASVQSRYGKVRLKPGLTRSVSPGTKDLKKWGPARRPYVTMSMIEKRTHVVRKVYRRLKAYERSIRRDLTEGLN